MAIVVKKDTEERYSHLKKLYTGDNEEKITKSSDNGEVKFKKEEIVVDKKESLKILAVIAALIVLGLAGFLIQRFA